VRGGGVKIIVKDMKENTKTVKENGLPRKQNLLAKTIKKYEAKLQKAILLVIITQLCVSCGKENELYKDIPKEYHAKLDSVFAVAGDNSEQLKKAIKGVPKEQKEAMAFLISYMPERDLTTLSADFLIENVTYAFKAKEKFSWAKNLPKEIFFNEVLPFATLNETRDNWRKDFFERFSKYVENAPDIFAAIDAVNQNIRDEVLVDYSTTREKADQSPYESMRQNVASCTGLSILLTAAFRSVGIPSRIAGTPNWYDKRGNHNWCEVWADGKWYFTEYYPDALNRSWFLSSAGMADSNSREHAIFATSFKPTGITFPLVWDKNIDYVFAENVTRRYIEIYNEQQNEKLQSDDFIAVRVRFIDNTVEESDKRIAVNIDVFDAVGNQVDGGRTSDVTKDLNNFLTFILRKNHDYIFRYSLENGKNLEHKFRTKDTEMLIELEK